MDYTLSETHEKIKVLADKMGSDYFPLPVILQYFQTATLNFVGEKLKAIERTQEVTDDISNLIVVSELAVTESVPGSQKYIAAIPTNYLRTVAYDVIYADNSRCRRADKIRQAEYRIARNNPNRSPNKNYPLILQENSLFQIDSGTTIPITFELTYCKKPSFATTGSPNTRIVNLPDDAIEKVLYTTITNLFNKTADPRSQSTYQLEEAFRKVFR